VAEVNTIVGPDSQGAALAASAEAGDTPNQLHDRTRGMIAKCLILRG